MKCKTCGRKTCAVVAGNCLTCHTALGAPPANPGKKKRGRPFKTPEQIKETIRRWNIKNREKILASKRAYYQRRKGKPCACPLHACPPSSPSKKESPCKK